MCGIFFSLSRKGFTYPGDTTNRLINCRGPDSFQSHVISLSENPPTTTGSDDSVYLTFISSVLALRGDHVAAQPLVDSTSQSVLCWNGEAWKIADQPVRGNDAQHIFQLLLEAARPQTSPEHGRGENTLTQILRAISGISGPFSFLFYDEYGSRIIYGRDCLGRRSLLHGHDSDGNFRVASVCDGTPSRNFEEVGTDGIVVIDINRIRGTDCSLGGETVPWSVEANSELQSRIPPMNRSLPVDDPPCLQPTSPSVEGLERLLRNSLSQRVQNIPDLHRTSSSEANVAVLFSGGLDCTVLARLAHDLLPANEPIDLLNVAFENPRVTAAAATANGKKKTLSPSMRPPPLYSECPDRKTGRSSYEELRRVCPDRNWRFVRIDVPYTETLSHREEVKRLMRPHNTEMDLSIACALYFAARGVGVVTHEDSLDHNDTESSSSSSSVEYTTPARVLLSGLGADELFAGYSRHGAAFSRAGYAGLIDELDLDVRRLGKRNLGRDDRVVAHWGREVRYPFLDEGVLADVLGWWCVWEKCGFRHTPSPSPSQSQKEEGEEEKEEISGLDAEKQTLRLVAWNLGMRAVAREKKRAIQFGARTAKMESGRSKGSTLIS